MRRNATKVAAVVMSLAVTMTSVNLPTTAAAATKKVKLNKTKATLTVGKTTTLKVTKGGKAVKATFKSSNAKVAKVVTKSGKSTKIKALKKGTAKITATYAKKKYTCKITVKAKKVTPTVAPTVEPTVAPTAEPTLVPTTEPTTDQALETKKNAAKIEFNLTNAYDAEHKDLVLVGTNANLKATVLDENGKPVANVPVVLTSKRVDGNGNFVRLTDTTLTSDSEGNVTYVFGSAVGSDEVGNIDAMRKDLVSSYELTATVAGSSVYQKTLLKFGALTIMSDEEAKDKIVSVVNKYSDDKKRGDVKKDTGIPTEIAKVYSHTGVNNNKSQEYVTKRQVSKTGVDNSVTFSSAAYLVIPGKENEIKADTISHVSGKSTGAYVNYKGASTYDVVKEVSANELKYATVNFDKVSVSEHTSAVATAYLIDDPEKAVKDWKDEEKIDTFTLSEEDKAVNLSAKSWQINLSGMDKTKKKYLAVKVDIKSAGQVNDDSNEGVSIKDIVGVYDTSIGAINASNELAKDVKVTWEIAKNVSYTVPKMLDNNELKSAIEEKLNANGDNKIKGEIKDFTYKYTVPAFPQTGNAIVTVYNKKGDVYTYYSVNTVNNGQNQNVIEKYENLYESIVYNNFMTADQRSKYDEGKHVGEIVCKFVDKTGKEVERKINVTNKGDIAKLVKKDSDLKDYCDAKATEKANIYELSDAETKDSPDAKIDSQTDTRVTVSATQTGVTHLVGKIETTNDKVALDASNDKVYTSVQWNPIKKAADDRAVGYAFAGQKMRVIAQLEDDNGNRINDAGKLITFKSDSGELKSGDKVNGVKVISISNDGKTNTSGQVELEVSATDVRQLLEVTASTSSGNNVTFTLNGTDTNTKSIDLYWLDLDLKYVDCVNAPKETKITDGKTTGGYKQEATVEPKVGNNWLYGVQVISDITGKVIDEDTEFGGKLAGHYVDSIEGVVTKVSMEDGYKGTYNVPYDNTVSNISTANGPSTAVFQIVPNSVKDTVKVTFKKDNDVLSNCYYAGVGDTVVDKRINLNINWEKGAIANGKFILPTGRYVANNDELDVYFKLVDKYGNAVQDTVTMKVTDTELNLTNVKVGTCSTAKDGNVKVTTDKEGRIKLSGIAQPKDKEGKLINSVVVTAEVDGTTYSQSYAWRESKNGLKIESTVYNAASKEIVLKFNEEVHDDAYLKDMFKKDAGDLGVDNSIKFSATGDLAKDGKSFNAKAVKVSGKTVTITLPDTFNESVANESEFLVSFKPVTFDEVEYQIASEESGAKLSEDTVVVVTL